MFIETKYNGYINTKYIENFEVKKSRNSEEWMIIAQNEKNSYVVDIYNTYNIARSTLKTLINEINGTYK